MVTIKTNKGDIKLELFEKDAPETVKNFLTYVAEGFYKNTLFHRVIPGFMIQGGGFDTEMQIKETHDPIKNEAHNGYSNKRGTIAMARRPDPHSASSQFFINSVDNDFLDFRAANASGYGYCVFGKVTEGMDVVDAISAVPTTTRMMMRDVPVENVVILDVISE